MRGREHRPGRADRLGPAAASRAATRRCRRSLGLGKRAPDEFQVVRRAPLVLPPDCDAAAAAARVPPATVAARSVARGALDPDRRRGRPAGRAGSAQRRRAGAAARRARSRPSPTSGAGSSSRERRAGPARPAHLPLHPGLPADASSSRRTRCSNPSAEAARLRCRHAAALVTARTGSTPLPAP